MLTMHRWAVLALICATCVGGCTAPPITLSDSHNALHAPLGDDAADVVVLVFSSPECPIANALAPEFSRLHARTRDGGGDFYLVHARRDVTPERARAHARDYRLSMPVLLDADHDLVGALRATVTPEGVVLRRDGNAWETVYQGRINDLYASLGNRRDQPTQHWLREGIDAALSGGQVLPAYRAPMGCFIE